MLALGAVPVSLEAQLDPEVRRVVQLGYAVPVHEYGPTAAYGFYYYNRPDFVRSNLTLRLAVVPVYLDAELGIEGALGPATDLAVGLSGGGFVDSYAEIDLGNYLPEESFVGHGAEINTSLYHLFNPEQRAPLYGVARAGLHRSFYVADDDTADTFKVPDNLGSFVVRTGLRLGGREPYLTTRLAAEFSVWYEGEFRFDTDAYGYSGDREISPSTHRIWGRALFGYTFPESRLGFETGVTLGTGYGLDRLSAYRMGSSLPMIAEFPLTLPGYHREEISAEQFALFNAAFWLPLDPGKQWYLSTFGSVGAVDYLKGLEQPGSLQSGVGGGLLYRSRSGALTMGVAYSCGINAIREHDRLAQSVTVVAQYDLDAVYRVGDRPFWEPLVNSRTWNGLFRRIGGK